MNVNSRGKFVSALHPQTCLCVLSRKRANKDSAEMREIMDKKADEIILTSDDGEEVAFHVVEQTRLGGKNYLLVSTAQEDEAEALILKDISADTDEEAIYSIVEDDDELDAVAGVFSELLEDIDLDF